jgi:ABC-type glutathione transport system ATPase component
MPMTVPLLEGRQISKAFPIEGGLFRERIGSVQALKDVSFQITAGETVALVGGSGCGKSTLAKVIMGLIAPDQGQLLWQNQTMDTWDRRTRARHMQMIFQDPFASLNPKLSVGTQLLEVVRLAQSSDPAASDVNSRAICVQLLESVGLSGDALSHYPFQFSGGQRQRIAIARALALKPTLLIADEPLSALDVTIQAHILKLLESLKTTYALTMLFISHDLAVVESLADRVIVLENGTVVEEGPAGALLAHPQKAYTQALLDAVPRIYY